MAIFRAMSTMQLTSGIAADAVVNTFHFGAIEGVYLPANVVADWQVFMRAIAGIFPDTVATSGHTLKAYDLADPTPRAPVWELSWSFAGALSGATLPSECSIVTSFQGERISGQSQARRRGRMYLGPLDGSTLTATGHVASATQTLVANATEALVENLEGHDVTFGVYSTVDGALVTVEYGWVDNTFDTQRRRGVDPTSRLTWAKT